jgi:CheY-like chemotaxis protein
MPAPADKPKPKILLVEDSETNATLFAAMLERLGYEPHVCGTGAAALERLKTEKFALALMDLRLPDMHGTDVARAARAELGIDSDTMPIVAITAYSGGTAIAACFEAGMDDYMAKPLQMKTLDAMLDRWLVNGASSFDDFLWGHGIDDGPDDNPSDLDVEMLESFIGFMSARRLDQMFRQFCEDYTQRYDSMKKGQRSAAALRPLLHPLIATAASMGLARLSIRCREIMDQCQDDGYTLDDDSLRDLHQCYKTGIGELKAHLESRDPEE